VPVVRAVDPAATLVVRVGNAEVQVRVATDWLSERRILGSGR
jgi:hypothetical protein